MCVGGYRKVEGDCMLEMVGSQGAAVKAWHLPSRHVDLACANFI